MRFIHKYCFAVLLACIAASSGCTTSATLIPTASSTALPTASPTAAATAAIPIPCDADTILLQVDDMLADSAFEAHYLTINSQLVLSLWLADPELDPAASGDGIAMNARRAFLVGASMAHRVAYRIPCVREVFEGVNPMIVDRDYNSWYIDVIPMRALPQTENPTDDELTASIERSGMETAYLRRTQPKQHEHVVKEGTCTWPQARAGIQEYFGDACRSAAAYLIIDQQAGSSYPDVEPQVVVQAQWDIHASEEMHEQALLYGIEQLAKALACLSPRLDRLEVYIVDEFGQLLVFGMVPGEAIYESIFPIPADRVRLHYPNRPE